MYRQIDTCLVQGGIGVSVFNFNNFATVHVDIDYDMKNRNIYFYKKVGQYDSLLFSINTNDDDYIVWDGFPLGNDYVIKSYNNCDYLVDINKFSTIEKISRSPTVVVNNLEIQKMINRWSWDKDKSIITMLDDLLFNNINVSTTTKLEFIQKGYMHGKNHRVNGDLNIDHGIILLRRGNGRDLTIPPTLFDILDYIQLSECDNRLFVGQNIAEYKQYLNSDDTLYNASGSLEALPIDIFTPHYVPSTYPDNVVDEFKTPTRRRWWTFSRNGPSRYEQNWISSTWKRAPLQGMYKMVDKDDFSTPDGKKPAIVYYTWYNLQGTNISGFPDDECGCVRTIKYRTMYGSKLNTQINYYNNTKASAIITDIGMLSITNGVDQPITKLGMNTLQQDYAYSVVYDSFWNVGFNLAGGISSVLMSIAGIPVGDTSLSAFEKITKSGISPTTFLNIYKNEVLLLRMLINPPVKREGTSGVKEKPFLYYWHLPVGELNLYPNKTAYLNIYAGTYSKLEGEKKYFATSRALTDYQMSSYVNHGKKNSEPDECNYDGATAFSGFSGTGENNVRNIHSNFYNENFLVSGSSFNTFNRLLGTDNNTRSMVYDARPINPNTTNSELKGNYQYQFYDLKGSQISSGLGSIVGKFDPLLLTEEIKNEAKGMYILVVTDEYGNNKSFKIVKP